VTQVAFHIGIDDRVAYACRLVRKALASGAQALVVADAATLRRLDEALWAGEAAGFTPHAMASATGTVAARSPVLLADHVPNDLASDAVLINMTGLLQDDPHTRERIVELVSAEEFDLQGARQRWKSYKQRGFRLVNHDVRQASNIKSSDSG